MSRRLPQCLAAAFATALVPMSLLTFSTAAAAPLDYLDTVVASQTSSMTTFDADSAGLASASTVSFVDLAVAASLVL